MSKSRSNMFDPYTLKARVYPMVILFVPFVILGVIYSLKFENVIHLCSSIGVVGALSYLFSHFGRDNGKKKEKDLWLSWGGAPSTQLLRFSDTKLDSLTKNRYHIKLKKICPADITPDLVLEKADPAKADEIYQFWTKFIISKTRDTKKFPLLFKENVDYGFRRNLWGLKPFAIGLLLSLTISVYVYYAMLLVSFNITLYPKEFFVAEIILVLLITVWAIKITKSWVKIPAFAYAERLLEAIDSIKN